jgi:hypothetical protein
MGDGVSGEALNAMARLGGQYAAMGIYAGRDDPAVLLPTHFTCCDLHGVHCEPPSELCCHDCTEVRHPEHAPGVECVLNNDEEN